MNFRQNTLFHPLPMASIARVGLPRRFTYPFQYSPHPLTVEAVNQLQDYLVSRTDWQEELQKGKMFGVLLVQQPSGEVGFLTAFSGQFLGTYHHDFFVPPVYDLMQPEGHFRAEEAQISAINQQIQELEESVEWREAQEQYEALSRRKRQELEALKKQNIQAKRKRDAIRQSGALDAATQEQLIRESQFQKAELVRLRTQWEDRLNQSLQRKNQLFERIEGLKQERQQRSAALQQWLFQQFHLRNAFGEERDLFRIFDDELHRLPPGGAGECAAPKLLQYAYCQGWHPLAMAEFWWGNSPKLELRRHGHYYPACQGKCGPILRFMLQGLEVDPSPLVGQQDWNPPIVYEDSWILVINKPSGMLTVPGREAGYSVYDWAREHYPDAEPPMIVHRLDMATSGLLILTKTREANRLLQVEFYNRRVKKRYIALLDGQLAGPDSGDIDLPLIPDPFDRPRQVVDWEHGKSAFTHYEVLERNEKTTRVAFYPATGRTHQLRVHAAAPLGLNLPILGDPLYGRPAVRLYLHAEQITFFHPITGSPVHFEVPPEF